MEELKKIIKQLPEEKSSKVAENIVSKIINRELSRLKEKKSSWLLLAGLLVLMILGFSKALESAEALGTADFWDLVGLDKNFLDFQTFLEGNPLIEAIFILFISLLLIVPIWVIRHKDKVIGR